ncbi:FecR family protein [Dyella sp. OK004]|uniref:FecR family protein n=1 Tax=Dyella sp. OK004 TaxID=1855292 RepID=UPI0015A512F7|nr:FecR family protein [Dyella sp. OK004]
MADMGTGSGSHEQAAHWLARLLDSDVSAEEQAAFEHWRAASPENDSAYREMERLWAQSSETIKHPAILAAADRAMRSDRQRARFRGSWPLKIALAAAAVLVVGVFASRWAVVPSDPLGTHYASMAGQQRTLHFKDGSSVVLDTDSEVVERYSAGTRRVDLLHGRAQFQVKGDHAWPFVVHTQGGTVTAVGTLFQVRMQDKVAAVTLLEGRLEVVAPPRNGASQTRSLTAGQQVKYDRSGQMSAVHDADRPLAEGWTTGRLVVHDWRLSELVAEMNRYSAMQLIVADPSLEDIHISGNFSAGDQTSLIQMLQQGWPIAVHQVSDRKVELVRRH